MVDGTPHIIDGVTRFNVACKYPDKFPELEYRIVEKPENEILLHRILLNETKIRGILEICRWVEHILELHGLQPGKKRQILGLEDVNQELMTKLCKDRYEYACHLVRPACCARTLRKLMYVYYAPQSPTRTELLNNIELGYSSIEHAFHYIKTLELKEKKVELTPVIAIRNPAGGQKNYQLINGDARNLDKIKDDSIRLGITSPPYYNLREYRNQGDCPLGKESTTEEYINNLVEIFRGFRKKLIENGVLVVNIGETYRNGYQGIQCSLEYQLRKDGWRVLDNVTWEKTNPKFAPHPFRFKNVKETFLVLCKSQTLDPYFEDVVIDVRNPKKKLGRCTNLDKGQRKYYIINSEKTLSNVIRTSCFNNSEHKIIDPFYKNDAGASEGIYHIFIQAYSKEGDTICDMFCGAGTIGIGLTMNRSVVAVDIDPVNIEFCEKRFEELLKNDMDTSQDTDTNDVVEQKAA
jgi:site-specific DNA-methyltransferase (adenine-specific)